MFSLKYLVDSNRSINSNLDKKLFKAATLDVLSHRMKKSKYNVEFTSKKYKIANEIIVFPSGYVIVEIFWHIWRAAYRLVQSVGGAG